jgi:hypothetical protein
MLETIDKTFQAAVDLGLNKDHYGWVELAHTYSRLSQPEITANRLHKILEIVTNQSSHRVAILTLLIETTNQMKPEGGTEFTELQQALTDDLQATKQLESGEQVQRLKSLFESYRMLLNTEREKGLDEILAATENLEPSDRVDMRMLLAEEYYQLSKREKVERLLDQVHSTANAAKSLKEKSLILSRVASLYAKLHKWPESLAAAQSIGNDAIALSALSRILIVWNDGLHAEKKMEVLEPMFEGLGGDI